MQKDKVEYGIAGYGAPELASDIEWIDENGNPREAIKLSERKNKKLVIYGFQSWCPGCHSRGLPALKQMVTALEGDDSVEFFAIQTVFEGESSNTKDKLRETQEQYDLKIPFGHDIGNEETGGRSSTMYNFRTGGTPWFIIINEKGTVVFNDFHLNVEMAIKYLKNEELPEE